MCRCDDATRLILPLLLTLLTAAAVEGSWNLMMNESETRRILGVNGGLYYVRNGTVNDYALTFNLLLRADITEIYFNWNASADQSPLLYRLSAFSSNANAIREPSFSIAKTGRIPTRLTGFSVGLPCSGLVSAEVDVRILVNVTTLNGNTTVVEIRRRKACFTGKRQVNQATAAAGTDGDSTDAEDEDEMLIAMDVNVDGRRSRGKVDGVILYACIGSACLASILVGASVVACRRRTTQSRNVASNQRLQLRWQTVDKHPLSAFDTQQKRRECVGGSEKESHRNSASDCNRTAGDVSLPGSHGPLSPSNVMTSSSTSSASFGDIKISRRLVSMRKLLMEGTRGHLYFAVLGDAVTKDANQTGLLVKTITDKASRDDVEEMLREASLLRGVQHSNVKSVAAICVEPGSPPLLVYRFDNDCNLKIYLQLCRTAQLLTGQQLIFLAVQITYALQFLHQQSICHKDVAARNCTVDDSLTLRLGDSALASTLFPMDYHSFHGSSRLPVKWMSIEALEGGIYSSQSDVWSLGVTLWEMITYGSSPYADVDVSSYLDYIRSGYRLPQLTNIQNDLYALMKSCWHEQPDMRLNCANLLLHLNELYTSAIRPSNNS